jgi:hypothetical protein
MIIFFHYSKFKPKNKKSKYILLIKRSNLLILTKKKKRIDNYISLILANKDLIILYNSSKIKEGIYFVHQRVNFSN